MCMKISLREDHGEISQAEMVAVMLVVIWFHFFCEDSPEGMGSEGKLVTGSWRQLAGNYGLERCLKGTQGQPK